MLDDTGCVPELDVDNIWGLETPLALSGEVVEGIAVEPIRVVPV